MSSATNLQQQRHHERTASFRFRSTGRRPQPVRHETRQRRLEVRAVERVTPHPLRVTLGGDSLDGFSSPGLDDHARLFFPAEDGSLNLPRSARTARSSVPDPAMRDYTPRHPDPRAATLQIDFALHEAGPATRRAERARPGQVLGVGGPRGSFIVPTDFDWHLLVGDGHAWIAAEAGVARALRAQLVGERGLPAAQVKAAAYWKRGAPAGHERYED